jgi:hypothetical protein
MSQPTASSFSNRALAPAGPSAALSVPRSSEDPAALSLCSALGWAMPGYVHPAPSIHKVTCQAFKGSAVTSYSLSPSTPLSSRDPTAVTTIKIFPNFTVWKQKWGPSKLIHRNQLLDF